METGTMRVRFAPSPTGSLHLGNARTALFNWLVARQSGGRVVLRIEDTDTERGAEGSEQGILEDLRWLGLDWDEGPDVGGPHAPYRQSERGDRYASAAARLIESGAAYRCFCTDEQIEAERDAQRREGSPPRYSGRCREITAEDGDRRARVGEPFAVRFRTTPGKAAPPDHVVMFEDLLRGRLEFSIWELGDAVLLRRDGRPTYNFAVVVDDAAMAITLVLRGDDHLSNTPRQVLLYRALGYREPSFAHLPMVRGPDGDRLSKRHGATSVAEYRRLGYPPDALVNALALLGWSPPEDRVVLTRAEMLAEFDLSRVSRSPAIFDPHKLEWVSAQHIHGMAIDSVAAEAARRLAERGLLPSDALGAAGDWLLELAEMMRTSLEHFDQVPDRCAPLFDRGGEPAEPAEQAELREESAVRVVRALVAEAARHTPVDRGAWRELAAKVGTETGCKGKKLFHPIRLALTGHGSGPELDRLVPLIARGHGLFPDRIPSIAERASRTLAWLE
jgi:glutamyl-tRNA synthetase